MTPTDPIQPYRDSLERHGTQFKVTLWANERSQRLRFKVMAQMAFMTGKRVLDAGCSRGDLAAYLVEKEIQYDKYIGVDAVTQVIEFARTRGLPRAEFHAGDLLNDPGLFSAGDPQIICISGSLNTMTDPQVYAFLNAAWRAAGESLVFNFLSSRAGKDAPFQTLPARRLDTLGLIDWALSQTSSVVYRQDYFRAGHDATILMRKRDVPDALASS